MKVHLVSFADGAFRSRSGNFEAGALAMGVFDTVSVHNFDSLPRDFSGRHGTFMKNTSRGFGYWIWKPVVVLEALERAQNDDLVMYLDAGYTLNPGGAKRFKEYCELAYDSDEKMLSFFNIFTEAHWTKADLAHRLGFSVSHSHMKSSQLSSGMFLMTATKSNRELVAEWMQIAVERGYHYSSDAPSSAENHVEFKEHRHDQSIFSLLRKQRGTMSTFYEVQTYSEKFERLKGRLPAWATRLRA